MNSKATSEKVASGSVVAALLLGVLAALGGCGPEADFGTGAFGFDADRGGSGDDTPLDHVDSGDATKETDGADDDATDGDGDAEADVSDTDDGADSSDGDGNGDEAPKDLPASAALYMPWDCAGTAGPDAPDSTATIAPMPASFTMPKAGLSEVSITSGGHFCEQGASPRDIVFVIDVSESMRSNLNFGNDPVRGGTCGRLEAVKAVLDSLDEQARVALVTFDDGVRRDSGGFVKPDALRSTVLKVDILCEVGGDTNYKVALARTEELLKGRRLDAVAEVYFVSDGRPNDAASDGAAEAARIRAGASIATLMLRGDDDVLIDKIASKDAKGVPLHGRVETADDLAAKLKSLSEWTPVSTTLRVTSGKATLAEETFAAPAPEYFSTPLLVDPTKHGSLRFELEALDSRGVKTVRKGSLKLK